jgi:NADH dehydrogenase FAD-containing subunit
MSQQTSTGRKKTVVVVGGGAAGVSIVRPLSSELDPSEYDLILINPRPYRIILPATVRVAVSAQDNLQKSIFVPYDRLFKGDKGQFILGSVASIEQIRNERRGHLVLENRQTIPYDVLALVPGSIWHGISSFPTDVDDVHQFIKDNQKNFKSANHVVLVGGGAVGIELSGEIKDIWPERKVTIVHSDRLLLNNAYPDNFRRAAEKSVASRGVEIVLDDFIDHQVPVDGTISTRSGKILKADLVVQACGSRPNTAFISSLGPNVLTDKGFVKIQPTFQLALHPNIFAAGDVIDHGEQKMAAKATAHGTIVAANIVAYLSGRRLKKYNSSGTEIIVISNGKGGGITHMGWGIVLGNWLSALIKFVDSCKAQDHLANPCGKKKRL